MQFQFFHIPIRCWVIYPIDVCSIAKNAYELVIQVTVNGNDEKFNEKITQVIVDLLEGPRITEAGHIYSFGQATWAWGI